MVDVLTDHRHELSAIDFAVVPMSASYVTHYHEDRTPLGLSKDTPTERIAEGPKAGKVVALSRVDGRHNRYARERRAAA